MRRLSPWITPEQWSQVIKASGYTGLDLELPDRASPETHTQSLFVATALPDGDSAQHVLPDTVIVTTIPISEGASELCSALKSFLQQEMKVAQCSIMHVDDLAEAKLDRTLCISICELEKALLHNLTQSDFENIRQMLCVSRLILASKRVVIWVTKIP